MNIDELRAKRDVWPIVKDRIPEAISHAHAALDDVISHPDLFEHLERKFRKGEVEHDRAWIENADTADPTWLILEAAEEIFDFLLYQAMFIILVDARNAEREADS